MMKFSVVLLAFGFSGILQAATPAPMIDEATLDRSISPCDDFYQFACGGWINSFQLPSDKPNYTKSFNTIADQNEKTLKTILEGYSAGQTQPPIAAGEAKRLGDFYGACMNENSAETDSPAALATELSKVDAITSVSALPALVAQLHLKGVDAFFRVGSEQDAIDAQKMTGFVDVGGMGLPTKDYYVSQEQTQVTQRADYVAHISKMLVLSGTAQAQADSDAKAIMAFETTLAQHSLAPADRRDPKSVYHPMSLEQIRALAPQFDWSAYFQSVTASTASAINIYEPEFISTLDAVVASSDLATIKAYLRWHTIHALVAGLGKAYWDENFAFYSKELRGLQQPSPRWKICIAASEGSLGEDMGQAYVQLAFSETARFKKQELVKNVQAAFNANLATLDWLDEPTRERAQRKLQAITKKIGYPDQWRSYAALTVTPDNYLKNLEASNEFEMRRQIADFGRPVDRSRWDMTPQTVNAYYNPSMNEIVFPAGILQIPFFNVNAPMSENYGAIGMVIGHEMTHGFDDQGSQYDEVGNLNDWWSAAIRDKFNEHTQCLVDQYSTYTVANDTVHLNGKLTLGENIADLGGMKLSAAAYAQYKAQNPKKPQTPVLGFNDEQQLFVSFAQAWCSKSSPESEAYYAKSDPHSPPRYRVNGVLVNTPAFAQAFACQTGSKMAPVNRCSLW